MKNRHLHALAAALMLLAGTPPIHADSRIWVPVTSGTWNAAANWGGTAPTSSDVANIGNGGTALLPTTISGTYEELFLGGTAPGESGSISISGGLLEGGDTTVAYAPGSEGTVTISSGTWNTNYIILGYSGTGTLNIEGGLVTTSDFVYLTMDGSASKAIVNVTGDSAIWQIGNDLYIGLGSTGNTVTVENDGLVQVGGSLTFFSSDNYLRLNGGYIALFGNQESYVDDLLTAGRIQLWDGSAWVTATELDGYEAAYFATEEEAEEFSGHSGLGGYTIMTAVPEPGTLGLLALAGLFGASRLRRRNR